MKNNKHKEAELPVYLFRQGRNSRSYEFFGSHAVPGGTVFRVWAPNAKSVSVTGDFCGWSETAHPMHEISSGIWETEVEGIKRYDAYKYSIEDTRGVRRMKADPYAFHAETRPGTASKFYELGGFEWTDKPYFQKKMRRPYIIY